MVGWRIVLEDGARIRIYAFIQVLEGIRRVLRVLLAARDPVSSEKVIWWSFHQGRPRIYIFSLSAFVELQMYPHSYEF